MLSPCAIKRSLTCRSPPRYAAPAGDLLSNRPGRCENLQPPGSPEKHGRAASQAIAATQLMHLGQENGLREPEPGYETQAVRRVPRPGLGQPRCAQVRAGGSGRHPPRPADAAGSGDTVRLCGHGPAGQGSGGEGSSYGGSREDPYNFPPRGLGGMRSPREEAKPHHFLYIYMCVCIYV